MWPNKGRVRTYETHAAAQELGLKTMNPEQDENLLTTAKIIAQHLAFAWNYSATLRGLQQYARECPTILDRNGHFVATITYALWDSLLLKLSHCSDNRREATG